MTDAPKTEATIQELVDGSPEPLKNLGTYLADVLDDDHFNQAEVYLLAIALLLRQSDNKVSVAQLALKHYAETYCEGWCKDAPANAVFKDCGGCPARAALAPEASILTIKRSSAEWLQQPKYAGIVASGPAGWEPKYFDALWAERVDEAEFERRLSISTIMFKPKG